MKLKVEIERYSDDGTQTLGELYVLTRHREIKYKCHTLELPWKDNLRRVSCIPEGEYEAIKHTSPKFGKSFWIKDVSGRSEILIHAGNYNSDTLGCILPGKELKDIDNDGHKDVTKSRTTIDELWELLPERINITIVNCQ